MSANARVRRDSGAPATPTKKQSASNSTTNSPILSPKSSRQPSIATMPTPTSSSPAAATALATTSTADSGATPAWIRQQERAFTVWCNSYLFARDLMIDDLTRDLSDGVVLVNLIEQIVASKRADSHTDLDTEPVFKQHNKKPKFSIHRTENIEQVLTFLRSQGLPLHGITAHAISEGNNSKAVLGLIWQIILKYDINDSGSDSQSQKKFGARLKAMDVDVDDSAGGTTAATSTDTHTGAMVSPSGNSAKDRLLRWCEESANSADAPHLAVKSFASLADGRAFVRLINKLQAGLIDELSTEPMDSKSRLQLAFDVADRELGIPHVINADEFVSDPEKIDNQSVMTYLAFFKNFRRELRAKRAPLMIDSAKKSLLDAAEHAVVSRPSQAYSNGKALDSAATLELSEARAKIAELTSTVTDLQRAVSARSVKSEEHKTELETVKTVNSSGDDSSGHSAEIERLKGELSALQTKHDYAVDQYEKQLAAAQSSAPSPTASVAESEALQRRIKVLDDALKDALDRQLKVRDERAAIDKELVDLHQSMKSSTERTTALELQLNAAKQAHEKEKSDYEARLSTVNQSKESAASSVAELKHSVAELQTALNQAQQQAKANREKFEFAQSTNEQQLNDSNDKLKLLERAKANYEKKVQSLEAANSHQDSDAQSQLKQRVAELQTQLKKQADLSQQLTESNEKLRAMENAKDEMQLNYEKKLQSFEHAQQKQHSDSQSRLKQQQEFEQQLVELQTQLKKQVELNQSHQQKQEETERALSNLRQSSIASTTQADSLSQQVKTLQQEKSTFVSQIKELQSSIGTARETIGDSQSKSLETAKQFAAIQKDFTAVKAERDRLQQQLSATAADASSQRTASLAAKDKQIQQLQAQLADLSQRQQSLVEPSQSLGVAAPVVNAAVLDHEANDRAVNDIKSKHAFELKQLDKELNARIIALQSQVKTLEAAAKTRVAGETDRQHEIDVAESRTRAVEEQLSAAKSESRRDKQRAEELLQQLRDATETTKKSEQSLAEKLNEARLQIKQQRTELSEAQSLNKHRAQLEKNLVEERRKTKELLLRVEQIKKSRASGRDGTEEKESACSSGGSLSQRTSRRNSPSRSSDLTAADAASSPATIAEESKTDDDSSNGKKKRGKKNKRNASSFLINVGLSRSSSPSRAQSQSQSSVDANPLLDKLSERSDGVSSAGSTALSPSWFSTRDLRWLVILVLVLTIWRLAEPNSLRSVLFL